MKKRAIFIILVVSVVIVIACALAIFFTEKGKFVFSYGKAVAGLSANEALLILDYGGKERWFKGEVVENMTAENVFMAASSAGLSFSDGASISIDGFFDTGQTKWQCYLSGKVITKNLYVQKIRPKDKIICKYQKID